MKIIITRAKRYGGITTFLFNFLKNINISSNDIIILDSSINQEIVEKIKQLTNCRILYFPKNSNKFNLIIKRSIQSSYIKKIINNENVEEIFFLDWNLILDWFVHTSKIKIITFVHTYPTKVIPSFLKILINSLLKRTKIVTVSNFSKQQIIDKWKIHDSKVDILYNYSNLPGDREKKVILKNKNVNIVTIAHCESYKNPELWLKIALKVTRKDKNVFFHWYGDGELLDYYLARTKKEKNIIFHGYSGEVTNILQNNTTIYLQCSKVESLGISILDAMNYSIPVIVGKNGGMPELIVHEKSGYVANNKEEFIAYIINLINNYKVYEEVSLEAKERYEEKFSERKWILQLRSIINKNGKSEAV